MILCIQTGLLSALYINIDSLIIQLKLLFIKRIVILGFTLKMKLEILDDYA